MNVRVYIFSSYMFCREPILFSWVISHTFLTNNHVRLHSSQNASDTGNVYDNHLRSAAKIT